MSHGGTIQRFISLHDMPVKPGQVLNPSGSDGGKKRLNKQLADKLMHCVSDAVKLVEDCLKSTEFDEKKWAADTVFNRVYGKPQESIEHSGEINQPKQAFVTFLAQAAADKKEAEETVQ